MALYRIATTGVGKGNNEVTFRRLQYVCDNRTSWDGGWYTHIPADAKHWKTPGGAARWLAARPDINGTVELAK